ncbi:hypothetical protein EHM82_03860, partial [bacterium]
MRKMMVMIGLVSAMALTATMALAWGPGSGRGMGMGYGPGHGYGQGPRVTAPNLSAEQAAKIQKIRSDRVAEGVKVRTEMVTKRT